MNRTQKLIEKLNWERIAYKYALYKNPTWFSVIIEVITFTALIAVVIILLSMLSI